MLFVNISKMSMKSQRYGFTLAEVLITLSIIGVVAAMTIPTLINNTQDAQYKSALKKSFAVLNQAIELVRSNNGGTMLGAFSDNDSTSLQTALAPYLSYIKSCNNSSNDGCWHVANNWYLLNNTKENMGYSTPGFVLKDGTLIVTYWQTSACSSTISTNYNYTRCGFFVFDVNGFKGPNTIGKDIYGVEILPTQFLPSGATPVDSSQICNSSASNNEDNSGWSCTAKYLLNN